MDIQFIASIAVITSDPEKSRELFIDALGLPLAAAPGSDYLHREHVNGSKHFGLWPLSAPSVGRVESDICEYLPRGPFRVRVDTAPVHIEVHAFSDEIVPRHASRSRRRGQPTGYADHRAIARAKAQPIALVWRGFEQLLGT